MKLNTCKHCSKVFYATKVKPFCSGPCRIAHPRPKAHQTPEANLVGAQTNDHSSNPKESI